MNLERGAGIGSKKGERMKLRHTYLPSSEIIGTPPSLIVDEEIQIFFGTPSCLDQEIASGRGVGLFGG